MGKKARRRKASHNRQYEKSERAIQSAILKLFKMYRGHITARQVAKVAGLSRQTIYNHHPNINQAIINNEKTLINEFSSGLNEQVKKLKGITSGHNKRVFYSVLIFMAKHSDVFCFICTNVDNQGLLYKIMEIAYLQLDINWLPVGISPPNIGSERVDSYINKCVWIIQRWGKVTNCDIKRGNIYIDKLMRATSDAAQNRT